MTCIKKLQCYVFMAEVGIHSMKFIVCLCAYATIPLKFLQSVTEKENKQASKKQVQHHLLEK